MWDQSSPTRDRTLEGRFLMTGPPGKSPGFVSLVFVFKEQDWLSRQIAEKGLWGPEACEREKPSPVCRNVFCLSLGPRNWCGVKFRLWRRHMMGRGLACIPILASEVWDSGKYLSFIHTILPLIFLNLSIVNSQFGVCFWCIAKWLRYTGIVFSYSFPL